MSALRQKDWERLMVKVAPQPDGCWHWTASLNKAGYGQFQIAGTVRRAHRLVYETVVGPIPEGLQIDHLCRVRHCVNPAHMEPVTHVENTMRGVGFGPVNAAKRECLNGHPFDERNTYVRRDNGRRECRPCRATRERERQRAARRDAAA